MKKVFSSFFASSLFFLIIIVLPGLSMASTHLPSGRSMLQFRAGGHILGFAPSKAYLVTLDHALSVAFLDTRGVTPEAVSSSPTAGATSQASTPVEVVYREIWNGVTLTYHMTGDGIAESVYHVSPGADVSAIRLRYKVPVELQKDGSLRIKFESDGLTISNVAVYLEAWLGFAISS